MTDAELAARVSEVATRLGKEPGRVTTKDMRAHGVGSCHMEQRKPWRHWIRSRFGGRVLPAVEPAPLGAAANARDPRLPRRELDPDVEYGASLTDPPGGHLIHATPVWRDHLGSAIPPEVGNDEVTKPGAPPLHLVRDPSVNPRKILIIPDGHAHPDYDNDRFELLGRYIVDTAPDVVINIGDLADMPSLSSYDKGRRSFEGRRYARDIEAVIDAQERMFTPISQSRVRPRFITTLGNHPDRINRATNDMSEMEGWLGIEDLEYEKFGWEVHPFQEIVVIGGIAFCHYFATGVSGRPISGENIGATLIRKNLMSSVQGHSHVYDHSERTRADGTKVFGMSVGCFTHPDYLEGWNAGTARMWWRGLVTLDGLDGEGYYDRLVSVTLRDLERRYRVAA